MDFSTKHPSNMTCPAVMLSPWVRDLEEMEETTQAIKLPQRIYSKNWETNPLNPNKTHPNQETSFNVSFSILIII